jgi:hypothetical protein
MKSPAHHAKHIRELGLLLAEVAPDSIALSAIAVTEEAATQLDILMRIGQLPGGLKVIDAAVQTLIEQGHPSLAYAPGHGPGTIVKLDPSKQVDKSIDFNVSRN